MNTEHDRATAPWKEKVDGIFQFLANDNPRRDETDWITNALLCFDAIRNTYSEIDVDEVIAHVTSALTVALSTGRLIDQGKVETYTDAQGQIRYRIPRTTA